MSRRDITAALERWLESGVRAIGQVAIEKTASGFALQHLEDGHLTDLPVYQTPADARRIAQLDDAGQYRPLKTAPNLRRGWRLEASSAAELRALLDEIYPAMLGTYLEWETGRLPVTPFRATANRQTGMYEKVKQLTQERAAEVIGGFCRSDRGCLKTVLWELEPGVPIATLPPEKLRPPVAQMPPAAPALPLLCAEGCNLLIAAARQAVRGPKPSAA